MINEWPNGQTDDRYFDTESGLLARLEIKPPQPPSAQRGGGLGGGPLPRIFIWQGSKIGELMALKESRVVYGDATDLRTRIVSIKFDSKIDPSVFVIPGDVRELEDGR